MTKKHQLDTLLTENTYPGRGIVLGVSEDSKNAVVAYWIMGRSSNSQNRVFTPKDGGIITEAANPAKLEDPSLIIYAPVRVFESDTIVTNGDQTDTVYEALKNGGCFENSLRTREFEPDAPNYTPRISGLVSHKDKKSSFKLSILKSNNGDSSSCVRFFFDYDRMLAGEGRFISTYMCDGNPIPSFEGEPTCVEIKGDIENFGNMLWNSLNDTNKVSLFVRYINQETGIATDKIFNKYSKV